MIVGLRIDVDTFRGTRDGVPNLCDLLSEQGIVASFFFAVGPDNMGRHLWRLIRPAFFMKMLRTKASNLYGWDILLRGTLWPGPVIGEELGRIIALASDAGHEVGLHAWDHHAWQAHLDTMDAGAISRSLRKGVDLLTGILGRPPVASAAPAWKCNDAVLVEKAKFPFAYNSDCRGETLFRPVVDGKKLLQPQVPVTLPTYDEVIGRNGVSNNNYNEHMLNLLKPEGLNVLTIHAEVEGISCKPMFEGFLKTARSKGVSFVPLGALIRNNPEIGCGALAAGEIPGREGWMARQAPAQPCPSRGFGS
ncbi:MAG: 4-deoxy-4-formamido-L-arabinose-phosphoundecaprenol deformylase [Pseudomonadota bacterium]